MCENLIKVEGMRMEGARGKGMKPPDGPTWQPYSHPLSLLLICRLQIYVHGDEGERVKYECQEGEYLIIVQHLMRP